MNVDGETFATELAQQLAAILGSDVVGVYLHGSLSMGCFNPARSDVDILLVTRAVTPRLQRHHAVELLLERSGHPFPLELSALTLDQLRPWRHPTPFDFHFSEQWRLRLAQEISGGEPVPMDSTDPDLAAHVAMARKRGRVLVGAPLVETFPPIPEADVRDSILRDFEWVRRESTHIYGVLNACRTVAYLSGEGLLSKLEGGLWARSQVPAELQVTLTKALAAYQNHAARDEPCSEEEVRSFVRWAGTRVDALLASG